MGSVLAQFVLKVIYSWIHYFFVYFNNLIWFLWVWREQQLDPKLLRCNCIWSHLLVSIRVLQGQLDNHLGLSIIRIQIFNQRDLQLLMFHHGICIPEFFRTFWRIAFLFGSIYFWDRKDCIRILENFRSEKQMSLSFKLYTNEIIHS